MSDKQEQHTQEKPGFFKRMYIGAKSAVAHAIGFIPRGAVMIGGSFAASAALAGVGIPALGIESLDLLGISGASNSALALQFGRTLLTGAGLSAAIGGGTAYYNSDAPPGAELRVPGAIRALQPSEGELKIAEGVANNLQVTAQDLAGGIINPNTDLPRRNDHELRR